MSDNDHAVYGPSKMERIILCPASIPMELAVYETEGKPEPSAYAKDGSMLHHRTYFSLVNNTKENLKDLEPSKKAAVVDCINYHDILVKSFGHDNVLKVYERKVNLSQWGLSDIWGTLDCGIKDNVTQHLHIIDWKFGSGVYVSAEMNPQLLTYAAGAIMLPTKTKRITIHVVQPFIDNYSTYELSFDELFEWVHTQLAVAVNKCKGENPEFNPGPDQCRWCDGKNHCKAHFDWARENAARIFRNYEMTHSIPKDELVELIEVGPAVEKAIKEFKAFVAEEIQKGRDYEGLKIVRGRSIRRWKNEAATLLWLDTHTDLDDSDLIISKAASPAQVEKLDKTLKKNEAFQALYVQPEGKPTLVKADDPRPALEPQKRAVDLFSQYAKE